VLSDPREEAKRNQMVPRSARLKTRPKPRHTSNTSAEVIPGGSKMRRGSKIADNLIHSPLSKINPISGFFGCACVVAAAFFRARKCLCHWFEFILAIEPAAKPDPAHGDEFAWTR
jgi:hypothetical protein